MTPQEAHDQRDKMQLLDVREAPEWAAAHVDGATHIPMEQVPARLAELDRTRPVAVICRSGNRSRYVTEYLNRAGFDAHNVDGGLQSWARAGLPVQS
ncbi:MAG: rhodanese-like domain-containing protein [Actinomycetes bacterium]